MAQGLACLLVLAATLSAAGPLREVRLEGVTVYPREPLLARLGVAEGKPLRRDPEALARSVAIRYELDGYPAARAAVTVEESATAVTLLPAAPSGRGLNRSGKAAKARILPPCRVDCGVSCANHQILRCFPPSAKILRGTRFLLLRAPRPLRKYPLTEAETRR